LQTKTKNHRVPVSAFVLLGLAALLGLGTMSAAAAGLADVPGQFGAGLGVSAEAAGILLSAAIMVSLAMVMAVAKQPMIPTTILLVAVMGALTAIGWLKIWMIVMAAVVIAAMFANQMRVGIGSGGGS